MANADSDTLQFLAARHSVRSFTPEIVSDAVVHRLLQAAVQAPTAMHVEPWMFVVVQDHDALKRCSAAVRATILEQPHLYSNLHDPAPTPKNGGFLEAVGQPDFNVFYNANTLILICARVTNPFVAADCWLAAENLMLAATALGLGSCCIGSALGAVNSTRVKIDLGIPPDVTAVAAIVVGVPTYPPALSTRRPPVIIDWLRPLPFSKFAMKGPRP